jgi:predicted enzyme related to lactoylglutathione lyase
MELVLDCQEPKGLANFWREALGYLDHYADSTLAVLVPAEGSASPLLLQRVPEPRAGKNRMHLDIIVDDIEAEVLRLETLGARRIDQDVQSFGGTRWVRMSDPELNEFCVSTGIEW